jgi:hypothetical protein
VRFSGEGVGVIGRSAPEACSERMRAGYFSPSSAIAPGAMVRYIVEILGASLSGKVDAVVPERNLT